MTDTKIVYILIERGGEYSDAWHNNLVASHDRALLEEQIATTLAYRARLNAFGPTMYDHYEAFEKEHPLPERGERIGISKWPAGLRKEDITQEMRDERKATQDHNNAIAEAWGEAYTANDEAWRSIVNDHLVEAGFDPTKDNIPNDIYYFRERLETYNRDLFYGREFEIEELTLI